MLKSAEYGRARTVTQESKPTLTTAMTMDEAAQEQIMEKTLAYHFIVNYLQNITNR